MIRRRAFVIEALVLTVVLAGEAALFARPLRSATNYDEAVYLAALDALRHGQRLGSQVFAAQFPGFYDLLRAVSYVTGVGVVPVRAGLLAVFVAGTVGAWLVGRRFGGPAGGLLAAAFVVIAPPLDLFGYQVIADTPALALSAAALGLGTLPGLGAAVAAGGVFGAALSVKLSALTAAPTLVWLLRRRTPAALGGLVFVLGCLALAHLHALGDLWTSGVTYHDRARSTPAVIPHPDRQILDQIPRATPFFWVALAAAAIGCGAAALRRPLRVWPLWTWAALAVVFLLLHKPLHYNHLVLVPFVLAIASGATIGAVVERAPRAARAAAALVLAAIVLGAYLQQWHRVRLAQGREPRSNVAAARALERLTPPGAATVDDRPIISFLADRRVLGPLVDLARLRFETGSLTDAKVIADLPHAQAVVVSRTLRDRRRVIAALREPFRLRYDAGGVEIWVRTKGRARTR